MNLHEILPVKYWSIFKHFEFNMIFFFFFFVVVGWGGGGGGGVGGMKQSNKLTTPAQQRNIKLSDRNTTEYLHQDCCQAPCAGQPATRNFEHQNNS